MAFNERQFVEDIIEVMKRYSDIAALVVGITYQVPEGIKVYANTIVPVPPRDEEEDTLRDAASRQVGDVVARLTENTYKGRHDIHLQTEDSSDDAEYVQKVMLWIMGRLNELRELGMLEGKQVITGKGLAAYQELKETGFMPASKDDIIRGLIASELFKGATQDTINAVVGLMITKLPGE